MEFSLSLDWCGNSSCMRCELDLYIQLPNDSGRRIFYLLPWMGWCRLSSLCCYYIPSIVLWSAVSRGFYWPGVINRWLLLLGSGSKLFRGVIPHIYLGWVKVLSITDVGIGWWRNLMTITHTRLVSIILFRDARRWQKVNGVWYSNFVNLTLSRPFLSSASGNLIHCTLCNLHLSIWFFNIFSLTQPCKQN